MDLQSARCELRNPPGIGWRMLLLELTVVVLLAVGVVLMASN
jgi:hypothetical protein